MLLMQAPPPTPTSHWRVDGNTTNHVVDDRDTEYRDSPADLEVLALSLITTWATRTGRPLRDVPMGELSTAELEAFWVDDQLEAPYAAEERR